MTTVDIIRELCKQKGISVTILEKELGFGNGSLTKSSTSSIKADRLLAIAQYFNVSMEYLMGASDIEYDEESHTWYKSDKSYYFDDEAKEMAQFLFENPEHRVLFDASKKVKAEDIKKAVKAIGLFTEEE